MTPLTAGEAVQLFPSLRHLILLREAGWIFLPIEDPDAEGAVLDGAKVWPHGWRDCIRVKDETDALGLRMHIAADQHTADEIVWERDGTLEDVVTELFAMPAPEDRNAPNLVIGSAPQLWTPNT
jgi:hypothetical protein